MPSGCEVRERRSRVSETGSSAPTAASQHVAAGEPQREGRWEGEAAWHQKLCRKDRKTTPRTGEASCGSQRCLRTHTRAVSWTVYQVQEGRGIGLPERSQMLGLSYDAPCKKQNPQSVHTQIREEDTRKALKTAEDTLTPPQVTLSQGCSAPFG